MACECDNREFPPQLEIPAGLGSLPRQIASFEQFRAALLADVPLHPALRNWRARSADDFGVMLLEMWAYICDVLSLYDKVIADESYVRTAKLRPSLRKLVGLLGYVPRPAVAAAVKLGVLADGKLGVTLPAGSAFRSGSFDGEPPQVFEATTHAGVHPALNELQILPSRDRYLPASFSSLLLVAATAKVRRGQHVLIQTDSDVTHTIARGITKTTRITDSDGARYIKVDLDSPVVTDGTKTFADARILAPTKSTPLRRTSFAGEIETFYPVTNGVALTLGGVFRDIHFRDPVMLSVEEDFRAFSAYWIGEHNLIVVPQQTIALGGGGTATIPPIRAPFTTLLLVPGANDHPGATGIWTQQTGAQVTAHIAFADAGTIAAAAKTTLAADDPMFLAALHVGPSGPPAPYRFFLVDDETRAIELDGAIDFAAAKLVPSGNPVFAPPLALPVTVNGNLIDATRGETVPFEVLGSGDASLVDQSFTLKKAPLTYLPAVDNSESGVTSTLVILVDGVRWTEVPTFFGQRPDAEVFIVREKDDGKAVVTFGDGINGACLPTGNGNVVATYRSGAGAKSPPANSITHLAKSVPGIKSVINPIAAAGGADSQSGGVLRVLAPRSALLLGRAVSILDMEAAASVFPGVEVATAAWRWDGVRQRPVVKVWYVGAASIAAKLTQRLRSLSDPSTPIDVHQALPFVRTLRIDVESDPRRVASEVAASVKDALLDPQTGLLPVQRLGIEKPLFRSRLFEAVEHVAGALGVRGLLYDNLPFLLYGVKPLAGHYFDFNADTVFVTGSPKQDVISA